MKRNSMQPLTEQEKLFSESNHGLVYSFLHRYGYSIDDFYDIVVFGFLKAVQVFHRKEDVKRKYDFAFIAWQYMRAEVGNYLRIKSALKRKTEADAASLDERHTTFGKKLEDGIVRKESFLQYIQELNRVQREILGWKIAGYSSKEICAGLELKKSTYYKYWNRIKMGLEDVLRVG